MHYVWLKGKNMSIDKTYDEAMHPAMTEKMKEFMDEHLKANKYLQTPITTNDGEVVVLYSNQPFTEEEIETISELTLKEIQLFLGKICNFKCHKFNGE